MLNRWQLVRDLFERAIDVQPDDLDAWLADATDDPEVRAEVRSLINEHTEAGLFLSEPVQDRVPGLVDDGEEAFPPGHKVGPYQIVRQLPPGGMGRVYLAIDTNLGRDVVLKAVASRFAGDPAHEERLRREAQRLAELDHEGICKVYAFEEYKDEAFIVTEYVKGRTLREEIAVGTRPTPDEVLRTARDIAAALACAHASRIAHRDLKPENVMRTPNGRIKIIDFGIARVDGPDDDPRAIGVTQTGVVIGTPGYMAPEQLEGRRGDTRTDVFAFGVLIYEFACGVHPFAASSPLGVAARILQSDPTPMPAVYPALPGSVWAVLDRCLKKSPAERFGSAADVAAALTDDQPSAVDHVSAAIGWWRTHQTIIIALYFLASTVAWFIKSELGTLALANFGLIGLASTAGGVLRGHLLFVQRMHPPAALAAERRRTNTLTFLIDGVIAAALIVDSVLLSTARPLAAVLIAGLGVGIIVVRLVVEPSTTAAAFDR